MRLPVSARLATLLLLLAACGGTSAPLGSVSGTIVDATTGGPVSGITVRLVDDAFVPFTDPAAFGGSFEAMNTANQAAFVATATTGADGAYAMRDIRAGTYTVVPAPPSPQVAFVAASGATPTVAVAGDSHRADFTATVSNADLPFFTIDIAFKNLPPGSTLVSPYRREWITVIPNFVGPEAAAQFGDATRLLTPDGSGAATAQFAFRWGYTALVYTLDNAIYFQVGHDGSGMRHTNLVSWPLGSTPGASFFSYDFTTNVLTPL